MNPSTFPPQRPAIRRIRRRALVGLAAVAPLMFAAACGDDSESTPASEPPPSDETLPPATDAPGGAIEHPTGADDVVVRIAHEGGFVPVEMNFSRTASLIVTGDGRAIVEGPVIAIYPGPMLPNLQVQSFGDDGVQEVLALADEHGLLQEREYASNDMIADAADTVVTIAAGGEVYEHRAYALGMDDETDEARIALDAFVEEALALANDGTLEPYASDSFLIKAFPATEMADDVEPNYVDWPADAPVDLADASECASVPADGFAELFADATQITVFVDDGVDHRLAVAPAVPGRATC